MSESLQNLLEACGAMHRFELGSGRHVILTCGRFKGHETWDKKYNPRRHFDDKWQKSWAEKDPTKPYQAPTHVKAEVDPRFPNPQWKYSIVDQQPYGPRRNVPMCIQCGVWECFQCPFNFHREDAKRDETQHCPKCGGTIGFLIGRRHNPNREHHRPLTVPEPLFLYRVITVTRDGRGGFFLSLAPGQRRV